MGIGMGMDMGMDMGMGMGMGMDMGMDMGTGMGMSTTSVIWVSPIRTIPEGQHRTRLTAAR